jgi:CheY-like chemotaxis protein/HPt (histidine-containing phosphotransfer) domain-containing protein
VEEELSQSAIAAQLPALRILVAEDGLVNQKFVRELLSKQGHQVTIVNNGQDAVNACGSDSPDVVLMDVQMPLMDGIEATRQIRRGEEKTGRHVPIVAMTAHAMKGDRERCLDAGMDQYVSKPLRAHQLFEAMAAALGQATVGLQPTPTPVDEPPQDDAIDWQDALDAVNGDRDTLRSVIEAHLQESPKLLAQMRDAIETGRCQDLQRAAHTLKGSLRFFGAHAAGELAWQLENAGKNQDLASARDLIDQLADTLKPIDADIAAGPTSP